MLLYLIPGILAVIFCLLNPYSGGADALVLTCLVISLFCYAGTSKKISAFVSKHLHFSTSDDERQTTAYSNTRMGRFIAYAIVAFGGVYAGIFTFLLPVQIEGVPFGFAEAMFGCGLVASVACSAMMMSSFDKISVREAPDIHSPQEARANLEQNRRFSTNGLALGPAPEKKKKAVMATADASTAQTARMSNATNSKQTAQQQPTQTIKAQKQTIGTAGQPSPSTQRMNVGTASGSQPIINTPNISFGDGDDNVVAQTQSTQQPPTSQMIEQQPVPTRQKKVEPHPTREASVMAASPTVTVKGPRLKISDEPKKREATVQAAAPIRRSPSSSATQQKTAAEKPNAANTTNVTPRKQAQPMTIPLDVAADIAARMLGCSKDEAQKGSMPLTNDAGFLFATKDGKKKVVVAANGKTVMGDNTTSVADLVKQL